jgi:hypothetical protein
MRLPPLSQLHEQKQQTPRRQPSAALPHRPPEPGQLRVAELLFANKLITPAQANRIRVELQRRQDALASPPPRIPVGKPQSIKPAVAPAQPPPPPLPAAAARPRVTTTAMSALVPSRSTIARLMDVRTLRSQFLLAEALQPPLALRNKPHLL